ncbi:MAG TPA: hypothetical protein VIF57_14615 [Polyangia bacterium]|jgi:hypothetical protein
MARRAARRRGSRLLGGLVSCLLALGAAGGCSFAFVTPPPANPQPGQQLDCSTSYVDPIVDTALAALGGLFSLLILSGPCIDVCDDSKTKGVILSLPLFILPTISAIYGYSKVGACRAARH